MTTEPNLTLDVNPGLDLDLDQLREELADFARPEKTAALTPREERIIAGFADIQRFATAQGRAPQNDQPHDQTRDIFERLYAVRLARLRALAECRALLEPLDTQGLLAGDALLPEAVDASALRAELAGAAKGANGQGQQADDITTLRHVRPSGVKAAAKAAEKIANRTPCADFDTFKPLFDRIARELRSGLRQSQPIVAGNRAIEAGDVFVLDGLMLFVAEVGEPLKVTGKELDSRLRLIFANGTESNLLLRSLQRAFYDDPAARRLVSPDSGQLSFGDQWEADDVQSGTIYVLRSQSDHPYVAQHRELIHKIGVTGGRVQDRITGAEHDATYLLAKVDVVATYTLAGINRTRMERLLHKVFAPARLDILLADRFGHPVKPEEWFLVPLFVIDEAVARIKDGSITGYVYDPARAALVESAAAPVATQK